MRGADAMQAQTAVSALAIIIVPIAARPGSSSVLSLAAPSLTAPDPAAQGGA